MTETTDPSELGARSDDSNSPADPTPNAEPSGGERDEIDLATLFADEDRLEATIGYLLELDVSGYYLANRDLWSEEDDVVRSPQPTEGGRYEHDRTRP